VLAGVAVVGGLAASASAARRDDTSAGERLVLGARDAVTKYAFTGVVVVEWRDGGKHRSERVPVQDEDGTVVLGAAKRVVGEQDLRLVHENDGWVASWADSDPSAQPSPENHYDLTVHRGALLAGRATTIVEARRARGGALQERYTIDDATGLMLRREQLDRGRVTRAVGFVEMSPPRPVTASSPPTAPRAAQEAKRIATKMSKPWDAPRRLGAGFALVDAHRNPGGTMQLFYSDGLVGMSVFEQRGRLDEGSLPRGGRDVELAGRRARVYETASGETVMWGAGDVVYSCVTDAPSSRLTAILEKLPAPKQHSVVASVTRFVLGPFSWE
jgi:hypothetical protein